MGRCTDHDKKRYDTLADATRAALLLLTKDRVLRPYQCPNNGHFHLTSANASEDALRRLSGIINP